MIVYVEFSPNPQERTFTVITILWEWQRDSIRKVDYLIFFELGNPWEAMKHEETLIFKELKF
jgi:hypothetical protein